MSAMGKCGVFGQCVTHNGPMDGIYIQPVFACAHNQSVQFVRFYLTMFMIHGVNLEIRVHTPGKLASAQPMPHDIMPAKK